MKRITYLAAAGALVATSGLGAWAANAATADSPSGQVTTSARHGADDPAGHHRHHGADDRPGHHRRHHGGRRQTAATVTAATTDRPLTTTPGSPRVRPGVVVRPAAWISP